MDVLGKVIGVFSPERAYKRAAFKQALLELERSMSYDGASYSNVNSNTNWYAENIPAAWQDAGERDTLRARARDLERNSDVMNAIVGAYKRNVYGAGIRLRSKAESPEICERIEKAWEIWCKKENCDVTGTQSFDSLMRMAIRRKKVDGGILFIKTHTNGGFMKFKLQALEVDALDDTATGRGSNRIIGGIEYDAYNKAIGYHIRQFSPDGLTETEPKFYPAKDVIFYFTKNRPTQLREVSDLAATITRVRDINEFMRALAVKERLLACLSIFIKRDSPPTTGRIYGGPEDGYAGKTISPGTINYLSPGDDISVVQPNMQATDATAHIKQQIRMLGSGQGLSYELASRDMSETNYSSARQGAIEDDLTFEEERQQLLDVMDEIYEAFVRELFLENKLFESGAPEERNFFNKLHEYTRHKWIKAPKKWIDPAKEAAANKDALLTGQKTFADMAAENGKDWQEQLEEMARVKDYASELGIDLTGQLLGERKEEIAENEEKQTGTDDE
jgi:phage portal protein, lambda family